ncbi:OmpA family protein [Geomonas nitrogeniifigens]|uniref:OmpA family protein n=1 Tax=Geomonas diazotrophica TaxID=2843197 RepID=UPI001C2BD2DC|nr:OmpA family protein [Geomonas nitrogeniifigens]QXE88057.1 OmpA family protein [Geomonas nitrogeniifigens]
MGGRLIRAGLLGVALALALPGAAPCLTPSGTVISHDFAARFATPAPRQARSNQTQITVRDLADPELVPPRTATAKAGVPVDFQHVLTNRGNFPDSFQLKAVLQSGVTESGPAPALRFYLADGVTPVPANSEGVQVVGPVPAGGTVNLVLRAIPAAGSEGRVATIVLSATSQLIPARSSSVNDQLQVPVPGSVAVLKTVSPAGAVLPGTVLSYRLTLNNGEASPVTGVLVVDPLDELLEYQQGSAALPEGVAGTVNYDAGSRSLRFDFPLLPAGFSGSVAFRAAVRSDAPGNAPIVNTAGVTSSLSGTPTLSNSTFNTVLARALLVSKEAGSAVAEAGDIVPYTVRVENVGAALLEHVTVEDRIPRGFRYLKGSSHLDGFAVADPVGGAQRLSWDVGTLPPGGRKVLSYRLVLSAEVPVGTSVNWARASGVTEAGTTSIAPPASAAVKVRPSILGDKAVIMGRVFRDRNGNGVPDPGEPGEPGVRIYLEDGSFVFSDAEGKYSFTGIASGDHVLKIDRSTLDPTLRSLPYNTAFAGVGWSQFVTVPFGGPARGDFALVPAQATPTPPDAAAAGAAPPTPVTPASPLVPTVHQAPSLPADWLLVGLGSATVGGKAGGDAGLFHEERLAFYTRGTLLGDYRLTAAYDSDKERRDGVFQTIDPERYYPVYGDAGDIGYDAESRGKLYLKVQSGRSYLMEGDYRTDLSENEFSRYDRALNGAKFEVNREHLALKGFESRTEETIVRDQIAGNGTSGHYLLSRRPVFENSERVRIEVRDRYHSERVISVTEKVRYADYSIDYLAGTILFKEPVPSLDQFLNPVTIVITYQAQGGGEKRYVYGGRAELRTDQGAHLGGTAVVEEHAFKNSSLYGLDAGWRLGSWLAVKGEGAVSESWEKGRGSAWKTDLILRPAEPVSLGLYYRKVDADFFNPSMSGSETGTEKYGGRLDYRAPGNTLVFAESFVQRDETARRRLVGKELGVTRKFSLLDADAGVKLLREEKEGRSGESDLVYGGVKGSLTPRLDATLRREQLLSPSSIAQYQSKTFAKLDYRLSERTKAFITEEYQEGSPLLRHATLFGLESRLSERMRLTTGYSLSSGVLGSTEQSNIDLHSKLVEQDGFSLSSRTGYQLEDSLSGERGQAVLGLNSRYRLAQGLFVNSGFERVQTVQGDGGTRTAFTLAGEYLRPRDLKLTGRYEIRTGPGETASLYDAHAAYRLNPSFTLLAKASLWDRDADAGNDVTADSYLGGAFRPLAENPLQLLSLVRYKVEKRGTLAGSPDLRSVIVSAEPTYRLVSRWTAQGKYAGKVSWSEGTGGRWNSYTDLVLAGLSYDLAERWELSAYLKLLNQYDAGMHSLGAVGSAGYRVYRNVVLAAGYNYARFDDRDLTGETFRGEGPFFGVKVKFDEDMFESADARLLPLPPPPPAPVAAPTPAPEPEPEPLPAVLVTLERLDEPLLLSGSAELFTLLVNGEAARLPSTAVTLSRERLASLDLKGGRFAAPLRLLTSVEEPDQVRCWSLVYLNRAGAEIRKTGGNGPPPKRIAWEGETDRSKVEQGEIYQCQLQVTYLDGSVFRTGRELFGVNRREAVLLTLSGGAFVFDKSALTTEAKRLLSGAARVLREHPGEKVIVEGHTDGIGSAEYNMALSKRRCDAAADYLVRAEGIAPARLLRRWYGKSRPVADNVTTPGRRLNRRVELKGDYEQLRPTEPDDRYRTRPFVTINGREIPVDRLGRYETSLPGETARLKVEMGDSRGRFLATELPLPELTVAQPPPSVLVGYGASASGVSVSADGAILCRLSGSAGEGERLELDGRELPLTSLGAFAVEFPLGSGDRVLGMVVRNGVGCSRLLNLRLRSEKQLVAPVGVQP